MRRLTVALIMTVAVAATALYFASRNSSETIVTVVQSGAPVLSTSGERPASEPQRRRCK